MHRGVRSGEKLLALTSLCASDEAVGQEMANVRQFVVLRPDAKAHLSRKGTTRHVRLARLRRLTIEPTVRRREEGTERYA